MDPLQKIAEEQKEELTQLRAENAKLKSLVEKLNTEKKARMKIIEKVGLLLGLKYPSENRECIMPRLTGLKALNADLLDYIKSNCDHGGSCETKVNFHSEGGGPHGLCDCTYGQIIAKAKEQI